MSPGEQFGGEYSEDRLFPPSQYDFTANACFSSVIRASYRLLFDCVRKLRDITWMRIVS